VIRIFILISPSLAGFEESIPLDDRFVITLSNACAYFSEPSRSTELSINLLKFLFLIGFVKTAPGACGKNDAWLME
jgi:hypothetical protein